MSGVIDKIYKDLTKGHAFPTGGVGFLSLEDAEVSESFRRRSFIIKMFRRSLT